MVRLLLLQVLEGMRVVVCFNPTMVRLLQSSGRPAIVSVLQFQSHNGAIAAPSEPVLTFLREKFQSHNGAIAARLAKVVAASLAQVSIPQWCDCCLFGKTPELSGNMRFNPTMVRLLPPTCLATNLKNLVSIPQWCDCCDAKSRQSSRLNRFQSHNGAIAAPTYPAPAE